jgi:hypothetical protein
MSCHLLFSHSATVPRATPVFWIFCGFFPKKLPKVERSPCLYVDRATIDRKHASLRLSNPVDLSTSSSLIVGIRKKTLPCERKLYWQTTRARLSNCSLTTPSLHVSCFRYSHAETTDIHCSCCCTKPSVNGMYHILASRGPSRRRCQVASHGYRFQRHDER